MLRLLFWNVFGPKLTPQDARYHRLGRLVTQLANTHRVDIVVIAESCFDQDFVLRNFAEADTLLNPNQRTGCRLQIFHRSTVTLTPLEGFERTSFQEIRITRSGERLMLVAAHLDSPLYRGDETRNKGVERLAEQIIRLESVYNDRTILLGDLNFSPFDKPIIMATGLHAVPSRELAARISRTVVAERRPFFYNPMWVLLGDRSGSPAGTYYQENSEVDCRYWHMPDQVLIRPSLLPSWSDDSLRIVTNVGRTPLLMQHRTRGISIPDKENVSDHLPLLVTLNL